MGLFTRKAGGTLIGNLFRVALNKTTGGILGNGAMRLPVTSVTGTIGQTPTIQQTEAEKIANQALKSVNAVTVSNNEKIEGTPEYNAKNQRILNYLLIAIIPLTFGLYLIFKKK